MSIYVLLKTVTIHFHRVLCVVLWTLFWEYCVVVRPHYRMCSLVWSTFIGRCVPDGQLQQLQHPICTLRVCSVQWLLRSCVFVCVCGHRCCCDMDVVVTVTRGNGVPKCLRVYTYRGNSWTFIPTVIGIRTFTMVVGDGVHAFSSGGECGDLGSPQILISHNVENTK